MIKFITEEKENKKITFNDVETDQFFVDNNGRLCQKVNSRTYNIIALKSGCVVAGTWESDPKQEIQRILPHVTKIEF